MNQTSLILWFKDIGINDISSVGGKNASLGEMYRALRPQGIHIPNGFVITAAAYRFFLEHAGLDDFLRRTLKDLDTRDVQSLQQKGQLIRRTIANASLPPALETAILQAYQDLRTSEGGAWDVAVRSSATAEDLPEASFAGQQETYLNVQGERALLDSCKLCFASLFTDRAISYRTDFSFDHHKVALSIGVQRMVRSDCGAAGVMFTIDTESGFRNAILINAAYGLGENVVKGSVNPDEYYVFKPTVREGKRPILRKELGAKELQLVYDQGGSKGIINIPVPEERRGQFALTDDEIIQLAQWGCQIEDYYSRLKGHSSPMDIEWGRDGITGQLFILQARPETVQSQKSVKTLEVYKLKGKGKVLASGRAVGEKIATGPVRIIHDIRELRLLQPGEILVTDKTDPDWEPSMKTAAAIITNRGGRTCHAAIVSRELGLPAIVGTETATAVLQNGQWVTLSCADGDTGHIYDGKLDFAVTRIELEGIQRPRTKIMMNVGNPLEAFRLSMIPNDGVGLARLEFIISTFVKIHPMALLRYPNIQDAEAVKSIAGMTSHYNRKDEYFVDKLAQGVAMIVAAFHPNDVIVRMSDFKTNEYANLIGGREFEPSEENPMIGFRGASRYYHERYRDGFGLECRAMKKVRDEMGLTNMKLMIPFCRTVEEGQKVLAEMAKHGLKQGENGLEIYVMCEIPSNVLLAREFAEIFDGFSIGSNDLTQLILGVDRDSEIVAPIFDERNPAIKKMVSEVIMQARKSGRKIGICGQAPSDYPEFAAFLVELGIDSISLNPDAVLKTTAMVLKMEESHTSAKGV